MKQHKISSKGFKAIQWTGKNKEAIIAFINGEKINFLFNQNEVLTIYPKGGAISLLAGDYLLKRGDGIFFELDENTFRALFEEIPPVPVQKTTELEVAESIWARINEKPFFEVELKIIKMSSRVEWVLKNEYADMCQESPLFTSFVKTELKKIFKENEVEI